MPTIQIEAQVSASDLLKAVEQLSDLDLERVVARVLALRAQRSAPRLDPDESELLRQINRGLPEQLRKRYGELIARRRAEALTADERQELLRLTDEVELEEARHAKALAELAQLRKVPLSQLLKDLGIQAPAHE